VDKTRWYENKLGHHCDRGSSRTFTGFQSEHIYNIYYICKRSDSFQPLIEILLSSYGGARLHLEVGSLDVGTLNFEASSLLAQSVVHSRSFSDFVTDQLLFLWQHSRPLTTHSSKQYSLWPIFLCQQNWPTSCCGAQSSLLRHFITSSSSHSRLAGESQTGMGGRRMAWEARRRAWEARTKA